MNERSNNVSDEGRLQSDIYSVSDAGMAGKKPSIYSVSPLKFMLMSICTFGIYDIYWSYKNWLFIKQRDESDIWPFWRGFFYPIWHFFLISDLNYSLKSRLLSSRAVQITLAVIVLALTVASRLPDPYFWLSFLSGLGFLPIVSEIRKAKENDDFTIQRVGFHFLNLIAYLFFALVLAVVVIGSMSDDSVVEVISGSQMSEENISFLQEQGILGEDEEIVYFYSTGVLSIHSDGQFLSDQYITSYYKDPNSDDIYMDYVSYDDLSNVYVEWSNEWHTDTVAVIEKNDGTQFEVWLSIENEGDVRFMNAIEARWGRSVTDSYSEDQ